MLGRSFNLYFVFALLFASQVGCKKSAPQPPPDQQASQPAASAQLDTILRLHWLGKSKIAAETNAAYVMTIWNTPATKALENQTLDKLASAPWRLMQQASAASTNSQALLRPMLDDVVREEIYLEARCATNKQFEAALAIRLDDNRAGIWTSNLPTILQSLGASKQNLQNTGSANRWQLQLTNHAAPVAINLEFARKGEWTIVGFGSDQSTIVADFINRVQANRAPFPSTSTNFWLTAEFNPGPIRTSFERSIQEWVPKFSLTINSEGSDIRTLGQFTFPKPLNLTLDPWNVPTNLIDAPLSHFTAIRGIAPSLSSLPGWSELQTENTPNQLYLWAQGTAPMLNCCAAPVRDGSNAVYMLAEHAVKEWNPWMKTNDSLGHFVRPGNTNALRWVGVPFLEPLLESVSTSGGDYLRLSLGPRAITNQPFPLALQAQLQGSSNLVYYSWEMSHNQVESSIFISQFLRFALHKAQVPPNSIGVTWLQTLGSILGNCGTQISQTQPDQLSLSRRSTIGFSSIELQFLVDWLESPTFPFGLTTFVAPPSAIIVHQEKTNSPPSGRPTRITNAPVQPKP
jgi:hypothetical protein